MFLTLRACENVSLRVADSLKFPLTRNALENSISQYNVGTLDELVNLNTHDFGIFLNLEPDEEQKAKLEENIQVALKSGQIDLEDAIDIREVRNIQLANRFLKYRRKKKAEAAQQAAQANIQAQAKANQETAEKAAMVEMQKQQALAETQVQIEQAKSQFEIQRLQTEAQLKQQLLEVSFGHNVQLEQLKIDRDTTREREIEDRKDKRTRISGTQQSEMISQRKNDSGPTNFTETEDPEGLDLSAFNMS